ncbi:MAG: hypothetical protein JWN70_4021 [Planctomycetaceae bacterium]|nr:hypothetical protein [Planctomycetaceae bacterium]
MPPSLTELLWRKIELAPGESIEIAIKRPTLDEQLSSLEESVGHTVQSFQLRSRIVDWRDVQDPAGQPVKFSWEMLGALCATYPNAIWDLLAAVRDSTTPGADDEKNSETPPVTGGTAAVALTNDSATSSTSIISCAG